MGKLDEGMLHDIVLPDVIEKQEHDVRTVSTAVAGRRVRLARSKYSHERQQDRGTRCPENAIDH